MFRKWALLGAMITSIHLSVGSGASFSATISPTGVRSGPIDAAVLSAFAKFPFGGSRLAERLSAMVLGAPGFAQDVIVFAESQGSAAQRIAAAQALGHAQVVLARNGSPDALRVFGWVGFANPAFRTNYTTYQSKVRLSGLLRSGYQGGTPTGGNISHSSPGP